MHLRRIINQPYLRSPEAGDTGEDGGGDGEAPASFDQSQVDALLGKQRRDISAKFGSKLTEANSQVEELRAQLQELQEQRELDGADEKQKGFLAEKQAREKLERAHAKVLEELEQARKSDAEKTAKLQERAIHDMLLPALVKAGVASSEKARQHALRLMVQEGSPEFDESGSLSITVGDRQYADLEGAAEAFLLENDHLAKAPASGPSPTGRPGGAPTRRDMAEMTPAQLLDVGLAARR